MSDATVGSSLPLPRWVLWLMLPGIVAPLVILAFIVVTQFAHDPQRCPYHASSQQTLDRDVMVVEEKRSCLPQVEERRYTLTRAGHMQVLGTRRLRAAAFAGGYRWTASRGQGGEVKVVVHNTGYGDLSFREGTAQEKSQP